MRGILGKLGARLGLLLCLAGFVLIFLGWNGAASYDRITSQFPYLISGGLGGAALVVVGAALMVVQGLRSERVVLEDRLEELKLTLERVAASGWQVEALPKAVLGAGQPEEEKVVAGRTSYHRPGCRLLEGRGVLAVLRLSEAAARGLSPCRVCRPAVPAEAEGGS